MLAVASNIAEKAFIDLLEIAMMNLLHGAKSRVQQKAGSSLLLWGLRSHVLWKTVHSQNRAKSPVTFHCHQNSSDSADPREVFWGPPGLLGPLFENHCSGMPSPLVPKFEFVKIYS